MRPFFILFIIFALLHGCSNYSNNTDSDLEAEWKKLYSEGGCLTGQQHWHGYKKPEGSVFRKDQWQELFRTAPKRVLPFLASKYGSDRPTNIHVCPFENATEGQLAVFVSEYILESNWIDCSQSYKALSYRSKKEINQMTQHMIKDPIARNELISCFKAKLSNF